MSTGTDATIQECGGAMYALQWSHTEPPGPIAQHGRDVQDGFAF
ncbi:hypothetical protein ACQP1O_20545 [Nocardia sp. CA-151230]